MGQPKFRPRDDGQKKAGEWYAPLYLWTLQVEGLKEFEAILIAVLVHLQGGPDGTFAWPSWAYLGRMLKKDKGHVRRTFRSLHKRYPGLFLVTRRVQPDCPTVNDTNLTHVNVDALRAHLPQPKLPTIEQLKAALTPDGGGMSAGAHRGMSAGAHGVGGPALTPLSAPAPTELESPEQSNLSRAGGPVGQIPADMAGTLWDRRPVWFNPLTAAGGNDRRLPQERLAQAFRQGRVLFVVVEHRRRAITDVKWSLDGVTLFLQPLDPAATGQETLQIHLRSIGGYRFGR